MIILSNKLANACGGLTFFCPGCDAIHTVWTNEHNRGPGPRWTFDGNVDFPTFSPSILVSFGERTKCHSFIRNGEIQFLNDCAHVLAGKTVPLPDLPDWFLEGHYIKP